jgi:hypothetical protein
MRRIPEAKGSLVEAGLGGSLISKGLPEDSKNEVHELSFK